MRRVLCIGDSLGLPRPGVEYSQTWLSMLRTQRPDIDFVGLFRRSGTTGMLSMWDYGEYLYFYRPSRIILQLGICDCSPRYMRTSSLCYRVLEHLPGPIQTVFWSVYKRLVKRSANRTDVSPDKFRLNVRCYLEECYKAGVENVAIIKIAMPGPTMLQSSPQVGQSVQRYNAIYEDLSREYPFVTLVDPLDCGEDRYYVDGYHPNETGNRKVAEILLRSYLCE